MSLTTPPLTSLNLRIEGMGEQVMEDLKGITFAKIVDLIAREVNWRPETLKLVREFGHIFFFQFGDQIRPTLHLTLARCQSYPSSTD